MAGDWSGSGHTGIGVFDPSSATFYLRNSPSAGAPDFMFSYGGAGWKPVAGDWDGNGTTTVGVVDPGGTWYIRNTNASGAPDINPFPYGLAVWTDLSGRLRSPGTPQTASVSQPFSAPGTRILVPLAIERAVTDASYGLGQLGLNQALLDHLADDRLLIDPTAAPGWLADTSPVGGVDLLAAPGLRRQAAAVSNATRQKNLLTQVFEEMNHRAGQPDRAVKRPGTDLPADTLDPEFRRLDSLDAVFSNP